VWEVIKIAKYVIDGILFQHKLGITPYPEQQSNNTADTSNDMAIYNTFHHGALMACGGGGGGTCG